MLYSARPKKIMFSFRGFNCRFVTSREWETNNVHIELVSDNDVCLSVLTVPINYPLPEGTVIMKNVGYIRELMGRLHSEGIISKPVRECKTDDGSIVLITSLVNDVATNRKMVAAYS